MRQTAQLEGDRCPGQVKSQPFCCKAKQDFVERQKPRGHTGSFAENPEKTTMELD